MAFEKKVPEWNAAGAEPPDSLKSKGFVAGYKPPADYFNWFWHSASEALAELQAKTFPLGRSYSGDMNALVTAGQYRLEANANLPYEAYYGQAFVGRGVPSGGGSDTIAQLVISPNTKTMIYRGGQFVNSEWKWEAWSEVYSTSNKPTAADVGAIPTVKSIPEKADLNTYTTPGFYYCISDVAVSGFSNCPTRYAFYLEVGKHAGTYQRLVEYGATVAKIYFRNLYAGNWGAWQREYSTVDKPTKEDVGLGEVPNVATNDQTPTYSDTTNLATLASGEKLNVALQKIKCAITNLINHLNNKNNPHGVTISQIGAAAESHGNHVPAKQTANNATFLRNDNTWQKVTPANIGAATSNHGNHVPNTETANNARFLRNDNTWQCSQPP